MAAGVWAEESNHQSNTCYTYIFHLKYFISIIGVLNGSESAYLASRRRRRNRFFQAIENAFPAIFGDS